MTEVREGMVPNPKKVIKTKPFQAEAETVAPAKAAYTKPQGSNPFSIPKRNRNSGFGIPEEAA